MDTSIFKAYDVRGKVGSQLTPEVCERIGKAMADWLPSEGPVVVGYDMRPDSHELAHAVSEGLRLQGREVWSIGQVASDMLYFAVGSLETAGGAMVTASHNPGADNGIKFCREQAKPIGIESGLLDIRDKAAANDFAPALEKAAEIKKDIMDAWVGHALDFVDAANWPNYRFAVDAGNGMAGAVMPHLEQYLPEKTEMIAMYWELDGTFPN
ncbi:MAG: phosphomannomutase/phosphoglucomutase, partial [Candidatus Binatia bacterium]